MIQFNQKGNDLTMKVEDTLFYIRKNKKLPQRQLLKHVDSSVYSKIESGKKSLRFSELLEILDTLCIPLDEFSKYLNHDTNGKVMRTLLEKYKANPKDPTVKSAICAYFNELTFDEDIPIDALSNYVGIKILFANIWEEISPLSTDELNTIYELLVDKIYYFHYDYAILSNTIYLFTDQQIDKLMNKAFPVKDMDYRNAATKEFITNLISNLITTFIRKKDYEKCMYYLNLAKQERDNYDLPYKIMLNFLENLIVYVQTKGIHAKNALETAINFLTTVGEQDLASALQIELETIILPNKEPEVILRNHFNQQY